MSETLEKRYERWIQRMDFCGGEDSSTAVGLIKDLMAEREKLKGRIEELTETIRERERYISTITS